MIVGAGPGGLATAMLLAQRGFRVQVFEKQDVIGGRNAEVRLGEYRFDLGPTFLMMKFLLDELFAEGGRRSSDYLQFRKLDPMYSLNFPGKTMLARSDPDAMKAEIEKHFPGEGASFDRFLDRESIRFEKLYPCLQKPYGTLASLVSPTLLAAVPHIAAGRSLHNVLASYFRSEELRLAFTFQSKYLGMSPWDCPGLFTMIPYTEHAHGVYHVMGGLCRISEAFAEVAREEGAEIHTSTPVARVLLDGRRACGIELTSGEKVYCDDVVINADFGTAMSTLFEEKSLRRHKPSAVRKRRFSCSTFMMYLGLDREYDAEHHTIVFARDYKKEPGMHHAGAAGLRRHVTLHPQCRKNGSFRRACRPFRTLHSRPRGQQHQRHRLAGTQAAMPRICPPHLARANFLRRRYSAHPQRTDHHA